MRKSTVYLHAIFETASDGTLLKFRRFDTCGEQSPTMMMNLAPVFIAKADGKDYDHAEQNLFKQLARSVKLSWILPILNVHSPMTALRTSRLGGSAFLVVCIHRDNESVHCELKSVEIYGEANPPILHSFDGPIPEYVAIKSAAGKDYDHARKRLLSSLEKDKQLSWMHNMFNPPAS